MLRSRSPWGCAIIVGASSGIGAALARRLGEAGCRLALLARREAELAHLSDTINRGASASVPRALARPYVHDVTRSTEVPSLFARVAADLGGLDLVIYAAAVFNVPIRQPSAQIARPIYPVARFMRIFYKSFPG